MGQEENGGNHFVIDCDFIGQGSNAYQPSYLKNAEVTVESSTFSDGCRGVVALMCDATEFSVTGSIFTNLLHTSVVFFGIGGCTADVSRNTMIDAGGIFVEAYRWNPYTYRPHEKAYLSFKHNDIQLRYAGQWAGIELWNYIGQYTGYTDWADVVVSSNKIHSEGAWVYGPVFTYYAHDVILSNNIITGSGPAAMYIGLYGTTDRG